MCQVGNHTTLEIEFEMYFMLVECDLGLGETFPYLSAAAPSSNQRRKRSVESTSGCFLVEVIRQNDSVSIQDVSTVTLVEVDDSGQVSTLISPEHLLVVSIGSGFT